jgi:hypothetical protein
MDRRGCEYWKMTLQYCVPKVTTVNFILCNPWPLNRYYGHGFLQPTGAFFLGRNPCVRMCAAWLGDPLIPSINWALSLFHLLLIEFGILILIHFPLIISGISKYNFQNRCRIYSPRKATFFFFFRETEMCYTWHFAKRSFLGTPTKRPVSKRQVSKRLVSKRPVSKHQIYKTSGLQNVRFQNVWFQNVQFLNFIYLLNEKYRNCQVSIPI